MCICKSTNQTLQFETSKVKMRLRLSNYDLDKHPYCLFNILIYMFCSLGDNIQDVFEPIQFKVEDLIQGSLKPFSSAQTAFDGEHL